MRVTVNLYSTNEALVSAAIARRCLELMDFRTVSVSRTIGPANYYEIGKRRLAGLGVTLPAKDIDVQSFFDATRTSSIIRPGSMVSISYWKSKSERWGKIARAISQFSPGTDPFFSSDTGFHIGPMELCEEIETEDGEADLRLLSVSQFCFYMSCDSYRGDWNALRRSLESVEPFLALRSDLEAILGPLTLFLER